MHTNSSSDARQADAYRRQEAVLLAAGVGSVGGVGGLMPPAHYNTNESMSSSQGSFVEQQQQRAAAEAALWQQQQQRGMSVSGPAPADGGGYMDLLASIPSAGLDEVLVQQQQQHFMQQQMQQQQRQQLQQLQQEVALWSPHGQQPSISNTTTNSARAVAGAGASPHGPAVSGYTATSGGTSQQQQQAAGLVDNMHTLGLSQQQQQQVGAAVALNGRSSLGLTSADLEMLLPLVDGQLGAAPTGGAAPSAFAAAAATAEPGSGPGGPSGEDVEKQESFMALIAQLDSMPLPSLNVDALLNPAANPLLNQPIPAQYHVQASQQQRQQQVGAGAPGSSASPAPAAAAGGDGGGGGVPEDWGAFLVEEDNAGGGSGGGGGGADDAAAGGQGVALRKRLLSRTGTGFSSCSLDLRQLSDLLMDGSNAALMHNSSWHKICKTASFSRDRRGGASASAPAGAAGTVATADTTRSSDVRGGGDGGEAAAADALTGLRAMSVTQPQ
jgi:hypothetical protein